MASERVLIVSEQVHETISAKWILEAAGVEAVAVESVADALAVLNQKDAAVDLILMGGSMVLRASSSVAKLLAQVADQGVPIVAIGSDPDDSDTSPYFSVLRSPIHQEDFTELLDTVALGSGNDPEPLPLFRAELLVDKHVMLIDESEVMEGCIQKMLQLNYMKCSVFTDADSGINNLGRSRFGCALVICEANAAEVAARIKAQQSDLPVLGLCTVHGAAPSRKELIAAGFDDVVEFPVSRMTVLEAIFRLVVDQSVALAAVEKPITFHRDPPVQLAELLSMFEGELEFAYELLNVFLSESKTKIFDLWETALVFDATKVKFAAHTLKGSSRSCMLSEMGNVYEQLDLLAKTVMSGESPTGSALLEIQQHAKLLVSMSTQLYLDAHKYVNGLQVLKVVELQAMLEAMDNDLFEALAVLLDTITETWAVAHQRDLQALTKVLEDSSRASGVPGLVDAGQAVVDSDGAAEAWTMFTTVLEEFRDDMRLLVGSRQLPADMQ